MNTTIAIVFECSEDPVEIGLREIKALSYMHSIFSFHAIVEVYDRSKTEYVHESPQGDAFVFVHIMTYTQIAVALCSLLLIANGLESLVKIAGFRQFCAEIGRVKVLSIVSSILARERICDC